MLFKTIITILIIGILILLSACHGFFILISNPLIDHGSSWMTGPNWNIFIPHIILLVTEISIGMYIIYCLFFKKKKVEDDSPIQDQQLIKLIIEEVKRKTPKDEIYKNLSQFWTAEEINNAFKYLSFK